MSSYREWSIRNSFNSFNTLKIMKHVDYWSKISIEDPDNIHVPPPLAVTIDPANICNFFCEGCNARKAITQKTVMSERWMVELPRFLNHWGVKAATLAGGGEPLMSPHMGKFFEQCKNKKFELALITNGYFMDRFLEDVRFHCKWVGVSVDAGTAKTHALTKHVAEEAFEKVAANIKKLTSGGYGEAVVTFKFLINNHNVDEIYEAVRLAKDIGCSAIHLRPLGTAWYEEDKRSIFSAATVDKALGLINDARSDFEDGTFKVFGVMHKFDKNWQTANCFAKCWSSFMYLVLEPNGIISTCCDNRGNPAMRLAMDLESPWLILDHWGTKEHVLMFDKIDVSSCPHCTFSLHNQLYEHCILKDTMDFNFI